MFRSLFADSTFVHLYASRIAARTSRAPVIGQVAEDVSGHVHLAPLHERLLFPYTLRMAARSPLLPSMMKSRERFQ